MAQRLSGKGLSVTSDLMGVITTSALDSPTVCYVGALEKATQSSIRKATEVSLRGNWILLDFCCLPSSQHGLVLLYPQTVPQENQVPLLFKLFKIPDLDAGMLTCAQQFLQGQNENSR